MKIIDFTDGKTIVQNCQEYYQLVKDLKDDKIQKINTKLSQLDELLGRLSPGQTITVGARTGVGKTSFMIKLMLNFLEQNIRCTYFTAEMGWDEIFTKMISNQSKVDSFRIVNGDVSGDNLVSIKQAIDKLIVKPFQIVEMSRFSKQSIEEIIVSKQPQIIFVDFIQRFAIGNSYDSRAALFSDIANDLKTIALENKVVVFVGSQLNRESVKGLSNAKSKEPELSDLKESGGIEESSNKVLLLYQDTYTLDVDSINCRVAKNREGRVGKVMFDFYKQYCDFQESKWDGVF